MNRNELVDAVASKSELRKSEASRAVDAVFDSIAEALKGGDEVRLVGFGTFSVASRAASEGRNPRTGEKIQIAASKQPKFKPGKGLRDSLELSERKPAGPTTLPRPRGCGRDRRPGRGRLAQLVEHLVYTEGVGGSSPSSPTNGAPRDDA